MVYHLVCGLMNERPAILLKASRQMVVVRDPFAKVLAGSLDGDPSKRSGARSKARHSLDGSATPPISQ